MTAPAPAPKGLPRRIARLEDRLTRLERALAATQEEYEQAAQELQELRARARQLRPWGLGIGDVAGWASVCRALGWDPARADGHRMVRRRDPVLHALLHRVAFSPSCGLDRVMYAD